MRNLTGIDEKPYDLIVVGGGIVGAFATWDAALRGLSVALLEKGDFGSATSANSLKIIHGGLRYLPAGNIRRMREAIRERSILLRLAPHLVRPLPFLVATQRAPTRSRAAFRLALHINDLISFDRNFGVAPTCRLPAGHLASRAECIDAFPFLDHSQTTGGAVWYDCQISNPERLILSLILSAQQAGARVLNYVEAREFVVRAGAVRGVRAMDHIGNTELELRASCVLNATGPWSEGLVDRVAITNGRRADRMRLAMAYNLVCRRPALRGGVGVQSVRELARDPVGGGNRYLFLTPWRTSTLIGTAYVPIGQEEEAPPTTPTLDQLEDFVRECNEACPGLDLSISDVTFFHTGLVPLKAGAESGRPESLAEKTRLVDHGVRDGIQNLVSVTGVKYTTARRAAEMAIDAVVRKLRLPSPKCTTAHAKLSEPSSSRDLHSSEGHDSDSIGKADVLRAVHEEMAVRLTDVVFRRTQIGTEGRPNPDRLDEIAKIMATELGWDDAQREREIHAVWDAYHPLPASDQRRSADIARHSPQASGTDDQARTGPA
ncbi:MAG: glycerol-3-phosphate dehydrogenase/oxidase [Gemmatimonadetes bacterium]|nr:glycerol-3-phosphate dehydrogenase/oxidase [Gemmatimonadota bacterium]